MTTLQNIFLFGLTAVSVMAATPVFAVEKIDTPLPQTYVHRSYEHQESGKDTNNYDPGLGRAGELNITSDDKAVLEKYIQKKAVTPSDSKPYIIGYPLPSDVTIVDVPEAVTKHLRAIPLGYKYARIADDVVIINTSNNEVIDAVK